MRKHLVILLSGALLLCACSGAIEPGGTLDSLPPIEPDYSFVTVPRNIAPLNFSYTGTRPNVPSAWKDRRYAARRAFSPSANACGNS